MYKRMIAATVIVLLGVGSLLVFSTPFRSFVEGQLFADTTPISNVALPVQQAVGKAIDTAKDEWRGELHPPDTPVAEDETTAPADSSTQ
jgi:hypothetical protein